MREQKPDGSTVVTEAIKVTRETYKQDWPAYNAAQTKEKSEIQALLFMSFAETCLSQTNAKAEADQVCP